MSATILLLIGGTVLTQQPVAVDVAAVGVCDALVMDLQQGTFYQLLFERVHKLLGLVDDKVWGNIRFLGVQTTAG